MSRESKELTVQTIKKEYKSKIDAGIAYYSFLSSINNLKLATRELQLLAFINYRGTISSTSARKEFCDMFNSSEATISNMVSTLSKLGLLVKEKSKTKINKVIKIDFDNDAVINFTISVNSSAENEGVKSNPENKN